MTRNCHCSLWPEARKIIDDYVICKSLTDILESHRKHSHTHTQIHTQTHKYTQAQTHAITHTQTQTNIQAHTHKHTYTALRSLRFLCNRDQTTNC